MIMHLVFGNNVLVNTAKRMLVSKIPMQILGLEFRGTGIYIL